MHRPRTIALDAFHRLAVAEAAVHGLTVDTVHFHEVGVRFLRLSDSLKL